AAEVIARLDAIGPPIAPPPAAPAPESVGPAPWTRRPATLTVAGLAMLALGIGLGVGVSRYTTPAETMIPPERRLPVLVSPDAGLETFDKALKINPDYAPALLYRGQVLYEVKRDYAGAIKAWQRFVALAPPGEDRDRANLLIQEAQREATQKTRAK